MNIEYNEREKSIIIREIDNFNVKHIFECGQCFRWNKKRENYYIGVVKNKVIAVEQLAENTIKIINTNKEDFENIWTEYFDLETDYNKIKSSISKDDAILKEAIKFGYGIRILNQEPFETLISFVISANNRIPMIMRAVENLCKNYGEFLEEFEGDDYYGFPKAESLSNLELDDIRSMGVGFRDKYIKAVSESITNKNINLNMLIGTDIDDCRKKLISLKGVGPKIADCVILFSLKNKKAFPIDTWVNKIMIKLYHCRENSKEILEFANNKFGIYPGVAQQYLFYYARETKL